MINKKCAKCEIIKPFSEYYNCSRSKDGKVSSCKGCESKRKKLFYLNNKDKVNSRNRIWRDNNPDKVKEQHVNYYNDNKEVIKENHRKYIDSHKEETIAYHKKYRRENRVNINIKANKRLKSDETYRLSCLMRTVIRVNFKKNKGTKNVKTIKLLGCSFLDLKNYIESKWSLPCNLNQNGDVWMNWDNHGLFNGEEYYGWDIDHIIPLLPSMRTKDELLGLFNFNNLQPLCSYINRCVKRDRLDFY